MKRLLALSLLLLCNIAVHTMSDKNKTLMNHINLVEEELISISDCSIFLFAKLQ